jgi:hypothetical protein
VEGNAVSIDQWEEDLLQRYPEPDKPKAAFRDYSASTRQHDHEMFRWVRLFNQYDLYTKSDGRPDVQQLRPYYLELIDEFLPGTLDW